jgi:hypothetical protein
MPSGTCRASSKGINGQMRLKPPKAREGLTFVDSEEIGRNTFTQMSYNDLDFRETTAKWKQDISHLTLFAHG